MNLPTRRILAQLLGPVLLASLALVSAPAPARAEGAQPAAFAAVPQDYVVYRSGKTLYGRLIDQTRWIKLRKGVKKATANPNLLVILTTKGKAYAKRTLSDPWTPLGSHVTDIAASEASIVLRKKSKLWMTNDLAVAPVLFGISNRTPIVSGDFVTFRNSKKEVWARQTSGGDWLKLADGVTDYDVAFNSDDGVAALILRKGLEVWATSDVRLPVERVATFSRTPQVVGRYFVALDSARSLWVSEGTSAVWQQVDTGVDELDLTSTQVDYRKGRQALRWSDGAAPQLELNLPYSKLPQISSYLHYSYVRGHKLRELDLTWQTIAKKVSWAAFA